MHMYNILFICYGNICRSPMALMIFKDLVYKNNKKYMFNVSSRATSVEELGNGIYYEALNVLNKNNVTIENHKAIQVTKEDYEKYDYIICMEESNRRDLLRIFGNDKDNKIHLLGEYTNSIDEIDDPWYTREFDRCFEEISEGCNGLFDYLVSKGLKDEI